MVRASGSVLDVGGRAETKGGISVADDVTCTWTEACCLRDRV